MANHRLKPLSPLGHDNAETVTIGTVTITENTGAALASVAARLGREKEVAKAAKALEITLPGPGAASFASTYSAIWLGPEQWMIEAPFATHEDIRAILLPCFGDAASITEQTDAWVRFDLSGADLPKLFERLCPLDSDKMAVGAATRSVIEHLGCYVIKRANAEITILGPRSSAASLHHALMAAAESIL